MLENTGNIKEHNQERIFRLLRTRKGLTKQEIGAALQLSMPTTLQNVNELLDRGILEEGGTTESTGGRRARIIQLNRKAGCTVGIDIEIDSVHITAMNLAGEIVNSITLDQSFADDLQFYEQIGKALETFLKKNRLKSKVLGVCISFPGIIDMQADRIVQSHIFGLEYVSLDRFRRYIPYPLVLENDANCMSYAEISPEKPDYIYLSLNKTVGGALVRRGRLITGEGFRTGEIGHMILVPGGKRCYCGKQGCADAYLSARVLAEDYPTLESFFDALKKNHPAAVQRWNRYLDHLAVLVTNLRMVLDMKIIIGGEVGAHLGPYMETLCMEASRYDLFARDVDYLYPCKQTDHAGSVGAALLALDEFGSRVLK